MRLVFAIVVALCGCEPGGGGDGGGELPPGWKKVAGPSTGRENQTATLLADGRVLVVGGGLPDQRSTVVELFDPATETWTTRAPIKNGRLMAGAARLASGKVLVAGGYAGAGGGAHTPSVEIYDPATDQWSQLPDASEPLTQPSVLALDDGRALITGAKDIHLYSPATNQLTVFHDGGTGGGYQGTTVQRLDAGKVLYAGGGSGEGDVRAQTEELSTRMGALSMLAAKRAWAASAPLPGGRVLLVGGVSFAFKDAPAFVEIFDGNATWTRGPESMVLGRYVRLAPLPDGRVVIFGREYVQMYGTGGTITEIERPADFEPSAGTATTLSDGRVLMVAGSLAYLYTPQP
jgi:hypothetical protein